MQVKTRTILYADEGKVLTNGADIYGKIVYLAEGVSEADFHEITEAEYEKITESQARLDILEQEG